MIEAVAKFNGASVSLYKNLISKGCSTGIFWETLKVTKGSLSFPRCSPNQSTCCRHSFLRYL